jgi:hypothetical protein
MITTSRSNRSSAQPQSGTPVDPATARTVSNRQGWRQSPTQGEATALLFRNGAAAPEGNSTLSSQTVEPDEVILQIQNFAECWKQLSRYFSIARSKDIRGEDETQFLEIKSVITQEFESVLASLEFNSPGREEVHTVICNLPSLRYLSQLGEGPLRNLENQWHQIYIRSQAALGQVKAHRLREDQKPRRHGILPWS